MPWVGWEQPDLSNRRKGLKGMITHKFLFWKTECSEAGRSGLRVLA